MSASTRLTPNYDHQSTKFDTNKPGQTFYQRGMSYSPSTINLGPLFSRLSTSPQILKIAVIASLSHNSCIVSLSIKFEKTL